MRVMREAVVCLTALRGFKRTTHRVSAAYEREGAAGGRAYMVERFSREGNFGRCKADASANGALANMSRVYACSTVALHVQARTAALEMLHEALLDRSLGQLSAPLRVSERLEALANELTLLELECVMQQLLRPLRSGRLGLLADRDRERLRIAKPEAHHRRQLGVVT